MAWWEMQCGFIASCQGGRFRIHQVNLLFRNRHGEETFSGFTKHDLNLEKYFFNSATSYEAYENVKLHL
jgi:hypothetical protein